MIKDNSYNRKKWLARALFLIPSIISVATVLATTSVFADPNDNTYGGGGESGGAEYNPSESTNTGCAKPYQYSSPYGYQDYCFGASWRYYKTNKSSIYIPSNGAYGAGSTTVKGCDKYGGYYRLGYERFDAGRAYSKDVNYVGMGYQYGVLEVNQIYNPGPNTNFRDSIAYRGNITKVVAASDVNPGLGIYQSEGGARKWSDVKADFEAALAYAKDHPEFAGTLLTREWNDTSWFCWGPGLEKPSDTHFVSYSVASAKGFGSKGTVNTYTQNTEKDTDITTKDPLITDQDTVDIDFYHRLTYKGGNNLKSFTVGDVVTDWKTTVKENNSNVTADAQFKDIETVEGGAKRYTNLIAGSQRGKLHMKGNAADNNGKDGRVGISSYSVDMTKYKDGEVVTVCSEINYNPKEFTWKKSGKSYTATGSSSGHSKACIKLQRSFTPPPPQEDEDEDELGVKFLSASTVEVPNQLGVLGDVANHTGTSDIKAEDDTVTVHLSTDADSIKVNFWHNLYWQLQDENGQPVEREEDDPLLEQQNDICTKYGIDRSGHYRVGAGEFQKVDDQNLNTTLKDRNNSESFCISKETEYKDDVDTSKKSAVNKEKGPTVSVTENLEINEIKPGQTVRVCEKITYDPSKLSITKETTITPVTDEEGNEAEPEKKIEYKIGEGNGQEGSSAACVEVTRPKGPDYPHTKKPSENLPTGPYITIPSVTGADAAEPMYAGESSTIGWGGSAVVYKTRRIVEWQAVAFQPEVSNTYNPNSTLGNISADADKPVDTTNKLDPCAWYGTGAPARFALREESGGCKSVDNAKDDNLFLGSNELVAEAEVTGTKKVLVPDYVGDKYCTSLGFKWQAWYGITHSNSTIKPIWDTDGDPYWTNYDAACRTIAKKPTLSVWNGGVFTNGGIKTSLAPRYEGITTIGQPVTGNPIAFGSWTEYLAVVKGANSKFGSGAAFAFKGSNNASDMLANAPLTIANNKSQNELGGSGISANSSFAARLKTYLLKNDNSTGITIHDNINELYNNNRPLEGTHVLDYTGKGELPINNNIIVKDYRGTIYQLPQVIIFADNITIKDTVTRIDAWLIATGESQTSGTINTCADFKKGGEDGGLGTEARVDERATETPECSQQLIINGPVIAKQLLLNRTAGADPIVYKNKPAVLYKDGDDVNLNLRSVTSEVFNLSANTYLWAYAQAGRYNSSYTESYTRELPPRY